ncbi:MAG: DUF58 domain-containing protein [Candidatus Brocadiia bacterium]
MSTPSGQKLRYLDPETLQRIGSLELVAREVVEGLHVGMHKSPLWGFSTEFSQHRPYVPGDEMRHIDWRVYGRTQRYYVKLFEAETNFTATLLLDASSSMHYSSGAVSKLEYAKYLAASFAYLCVRQRDSAGLGVFDSELRTYVEPKTTMAVVRNIAEELERVEGVPRTDVASLLHEFANRIPRRGFVMLFSDLFDNVDEFLLGLDHLRFRGHNVTVFQVLDPYELEFPFDGSCKFRGLELEGEVITQPKRIREAYLAEVRKFLDRIRGACERSHVDHVVVDTSRPVDAVISAYLIGRIKSLKVR